MLCVNVLSENGLTRCTSIDDLCTPTVCVPGIIRCRHLLYSLLLCSGLKEVHVSSLNNFQGLILPFMA